MTIDEKIEGLIEEAIAGKQKEGSPLGTGAAVVGGGALAAKKLGLLKAAGAGLGKVGAAAKVLKAGAGGTYVDPSMSRAQAAKTSGLVSALGTAAINAPMMISGGLPGAALGVASTMAGAKGAALGATLAGGRDTLLKSAVVPAGVVAAAAPLTNMAMDALGIEGNFKVDPGMSAAITGGVGSLGWMLRNRGNKNKQYV